MPVSSWSTTASDNATADAASGVNFSEGQAPSSLNDSMRAVMAVIKGDFANSLAGAGYQKLPNGLIIQWGITSGGTDFTITFPLAFPVGLLSFVANQVVIPTAQQMFGVDWSNGTATGINVSLRYAQNGGLVASTGGSVSWIAVGR